MKGRAARSSQGLVVRIGEDRLRPPAGVDQVVVKFGPSPVRTILLRRWGAMKIFLSGVILEPRGLLGKTIVKFYSPPRGGTLAVGSNLAQDLQRLLGKLPAETEQLDLRKAFAGKKAIVELKRVGEGVEQYAMIGRILREVR